MGKLLCRLRLHEWAHNGGLGSNLSFWNIMRQTYPHSIQELSRTSQRICKCCGKHEYSSGWAGDGSSNITWCDVKIIDLELTCQQCNKQYRHVTKEKYAATPFCCLRCEDIYRAKEVQRVTKPYKEKFDACRNKFNKSEGEK